MAAGFQASRMRVAPVLVAMVLGAVAMQAAEAKAKPDAAKIEAQKAARLAFDGRKVYAKECSACHVAYPLIALPRASWEAHLGSLGKHFGVDASLDAKDASALGALVASEARDGVRPKDDRVTQSVWFAGIHREVPASVFSRKSVGSAARCEACHSGAGRGDFDEDAVRIPR